MNNMLTKRQINALRKENEAIEKHLSSVLNATTLNLIAILIDNKYQLLTDSNELQNDINLMNQ